MTATPASDDFLTTGYHVVRQLLPEPVRSFAYEYVLKSARIGRLEDGDDDVPNTPYRYADPVTESLLQLLRPHVSVASGVSLLPTYSYFRVYKHGDVLRSHRDRPSCEISATIALGSVTDAAWPLWLERDGIAAAVVLEPGDGVIYRGIELQHWRERFSGLHAAQVFLHYVDRNGAHREWAFDKRPGLATSPAVDRIMNALARRLAPADAGGVRSE